jgi:hypothetical protein
MVKRNLLCGEEMVNNKQSWILSETENGTEKRMGYGYDSYFIDQFGIQK